MKFRSCEKKFLTFEEALCTNIANSKAKDRTLVKFCNDAFRKRQKLGQVIEFDVNSVSVPFRCISTGKEIGESYLNC